MRRRTKLLISVGIVLLALVVAAIVVAAPGGVTYFDRRDESAAQAPSWAAPCFHRQPRRDRPLLHFCARVRGRVVHVRKENWHGRAPEVHFAMIARFHLWIVKLPLDEPIEPPGIASTVTVVGPVLRVRFGLPEVQAWRMTRG
jgi:hypothetical protein